MSLSHSLFALESCLRFEPESSLHRDLQQAVLGCAERSSRADKARQWRRATELLLSGLDRLERGCWDYFDDNAKALADYEDWCQGMFTEVGDRALPSAPIQPYRGEPRYLTFTMAALVIQGTSTDHVLLELSEVPPARLWKRETFARLLRGLGDLDFTHVKSDVLYLIPRDEAWGLRTQELSTKRFDYLRPVVE